ncbi:MAG: hypothetical protein DMG15_25625 [Acidobacteria bacterium]|nr:MAG: hypothetical protein DMG15_25625 [Acidobacteriota bacterium]
MLIERVNTHQRKFTFADQSAFAELSGDYNPLHMDPIAARRYLFGQPVVHGIHPVFWALNSYLENHTSFLTLRSLKVSFPRPILLEKQVQLFSASTDTYHLGIELLSGGAVSTRIEADVAASRFQNLDCFERSCPIPQSPRVLSENDIERDSGSLDLYLDIEKTRKLFPHLIRCVSPLQIAVILATTRLVGIQCPGLKSIFSKLDLSVTDSYDSRTLTYKVTGIDRRYGLVCMKMTAPGMAGEVKAFIRPAPQEQASFSSLKGLVHSNEFSNQRALIIGGSRGIGEVTAKLLVAGGAKVVLTYHRGQEDARRVVEDIVANGGAADCCRLDVLNPDEDPAEIARANPFTHLYYFATPLCYSGAKGVFSADLFKEFCDYYITGFARIVTQLWSLGLRNIFYPSSTAINELPINMGEFAAAKIAGETLCRFLENNEPEMIIYRPRFPRIATDQTAVLPVASLDPVRLMIEHLRSFRDASMMAGRSASEPV